MPVEIVDCIQGSPEWFTARLGIPTASEFATILASGHGGAPSQTRDDYLGDLAGEVRTGVPRETFRSPAMNRGNAMEEEIRNLYSMAINEDIQQVGFLRNGRKGASPDGLVGSVGMVEIKTQMPRHLIKRLRRSGEAPPEHMAQCQGNLWVAEREWIDLVIGYTKMPLFRCRIMRSEPYIARLKLAVEVFLEELDALVAEVKTL